MTKHKSQLKYIIKYDMYKISPKNKTNLKKLYFGLLRFFVFFFNKKP